MVTKRIEYDSNGVRIKQDNDPYREFPTNSNSLCSAVTQYLSEVEEKFRKLMDSHQESSIPGYGRGDKIGSLGGSIEVKIECVESED